MKSKLWKTSVYLTTVLALTACGGGGGGSASSGSNAGNGNNGSGQSTVIDQPTVDNTVQQATLTRTSDQSQCAVTQATGGVEDQGLTISDAYWLQVVQQPMDDANALLSANKPTRVRVDVVTSRPRIAMPQTALLQLGTASGQCHQVTLSSSNTVAPDSVDATSLAESLVGDIPANVMADDLVSYQVVVNGAVASTVAAADRLYASGPINIESQSSDILIIKPITFLGQAGQLADEASLVSLLKRTYPQASYTVNHEPAYTPSQLKPENAVSVSGGVYTFSYDTALQIIGDLFVECDQKSPDSVRLQTNANSHMARCLVAFPFNVQFERISGVASTTAMLTTSFLATDDATVTNPYSPNHWITFGSEIFLHEFGHMMNLGHANCGGADGLEQGLHPDGSIGALGGGYDSGRDLYFSYAGGYFADIMSYCHKGWVSDLAYRKVIEFKQLVLGGPAPAQPYAYRTESSKEADTPTGKLIRFHFKDGQWQVAWSGPQTTLVRSTAKPDAGFIAKALAGTPVYTLDSHHGELKHGPYFLEPTPELLRLLSGDLLGLFANQLK